MDVESAIKTLMETTGMSRADIISEIKKKINELTGLIDEQGAIVMVATDHGIDLSAPTEAQKSESFTPIHDLKDGQTNVNIVGRVILIGEINTFNKKQGGGVGKVLKFVVKDKTGEIMVIAWDNHADVKANSNFTLNAIVQILNAKVKKNIQNQKNELHLDINSGILFDTENIDMSMIPDLRELETEKLIKDIDPNIDRLANLKVEILNIYDAKDFAAKDGTVAKSRSIRVSDGSGSAFISFWRTDVNTVDSFKQGQIVSFKNLNVKANSKDKSKPDFTWTQNSKFTIIEQPNSPTNQDSQNIGQSTGQPASQSTNQSSGQAANQQSNQQGQIVSIKDLKEQGIKNATIRVVVTGVGNIRTVNTKNGPASVLDLTISDDTDSSRISLWKDQAEAFQDLKINDALKITNVYAKQNDYTKSKEVVITQQSQITRETETPVKNPVLPKIEAPGIKNAESTPTQDPSMNKESGAQFEKIADITTEKNVVVKALIQKEIKKITTYEGCKSCRRKQANCKCAKYEPTYFMITNVILDDETATMRASMGDTLATQVLGITADDVIKAENSGTMDALMAQINNKIAGKEFIIKGRTKISSYNQQIEMNINAILEFDPKSEASRLLKELEPLVAEYKE